LRVASISRTDPPDFAHAVCSPPSTLTLFDPKPSAPILSAPDPRVKSSDEASLTFLQSYIRKAGQANVNADID
jgi:hypothetical protein